MFHYLLNEIIFIKKNKNSSDPLQRKLIATEAKYIFTSVCVHFEHSRWSIRDALCDLVPFV